MIPSIQFSLQQNTENAHFVITKRHYIYPYLCKSWRSILDQALYHAKIWPIPLRFPLSAHIEYRDRTGKIDCTRRKVPSSESEFNKFELRLKSTNNRFQFSAGLNLETLHAILSGTNHYLTNVSNLCRGSNSLNSASGLPKVFSGSIYTK